MNILVLDTETTSLAKPFCYDISWAIFNTESENLVHFSMNVVEQVWHNLPLFESAYYADKRPKYILMMRRHEAIMDKWGNIMQKLARDIKKYEITDVYAYNSTFDDKTISFNCDWFKTLNPLDSVGVHDIWGYASEFITCTNEYQQFCEDNSLFTEKGNYRGNAEAVFQYITENTEFIEEHMGLFDSEIEAKILFNCIRRGAKWATDYKVVSILPRNNKKPFTIKVDSVEVYTGEYVKLYARNGVYNFKTK